MKVWHTGSGYRISMKDIESELESHIKADGNIFIGCDSFIKGGKCVFASVICLHGGRDQRGGRYFWFRERSSDKKYNNIALRIFEEVAKTVNFGLELTERFPSANIELHIDVSSHERGKTYKYVDQLTGFAKSAGFNCQIKPFAWAAASIADKHSK
jgi:predicted RNase H-related nuclease YkuK (DUF458 family)